MAQTTTTISSLAKACIAQFVQRPELNDQYDSFKDWVQSVSSLDNPSNEIIAPLEDLNGMYKLGLYLGLY